MYRPICYLFAIMLLSAPYEIMAQGGLWDAKKTRAKKESLSKKLSNYKHHLESWGTDTSYRHIFLAGGKLNTDGWSGMLLLGKRKNHRYYNFWQISFSEIKHEKQTKQQGTNNAYPQLGNPTPYVYGKINNLYTLQVGFGKEKLLLPAVLQGNISVSLRYSGGLSLAMLKPYTLKLIYEDRGGTVPPHTEEHGYNAADSALFLNTNTILGAGKWEHSLSAIDYVPGAYFETALAILPGKSKYFIQVATLGFNVAAYYKPLTIMADLKAYPWQASFFVGLGIGERW